MPCAISLRSDFGAAALRGRHGIPILHITHALATVHQIADYVLMMEAAPVVEAGEPDAVIGDPRHPYAQELVQAVSRPDLGRPWGVPPPSRTVPELGLALVRTRLPSFALETP